MSLSPDSTIHFQGTDRTLHFVTTLQVHRCYGEIRKALVLGDLGSEGYLDGENNRWRMNTLKVPVSAVKFAQLNSGGGAPTPGLNEIEILIDQGNIANNKELGSSIRFQSM